MRPIKFRGKRLYDDKWVYGYYWENKIAGDSLIITDEGDEPVDPDTVGQYVCLDAEDNEVYEGDIVYWKRAIYYVQTGKFVESIIERYRVVWNEPTFCFFIRPLIEGAGMDMNASYIKSGGMVKEDQE